MCSASVSTTGPTEARGVLLVASLAQLVVAAGLALAIDSVAAILVFATLLGIGFAFAQPAEFSLALAGGISVGVALAGLALYRRPLPSAETRALIGEGALGVPRNGIGFCAAFSRGVEWRGGS